jgi:hypothetical protein
LSNECDIPNDDDSTNEISNDFNNNNLTENAKRKSMSSSRILLKRKSTLKNIKLSSFCGCKASVSWLFKQLFKVDVVKDFNALGLSKAFLREYPPKARYKDGVWDASVVLDYYHNCTESLGDLSAEEKALALHSFFLVKTAILVGFFRLARPMKLVQIRTDEDCMIREQDGGYLKFKPKSSVNKDALVFVPSIPDK